MVPMLFVWSDSNKWSLSSGSTVAPMDGRLQSGIGSNDSDYDVGGPVQGRLRPSKLVHHLDRSGTH